MHDSGGADKEARKTLIQLTDVGMAYGPKVALSGVNLTVEQGDFIAITGPNGGGKTTLLRIILGLLRPTCGRVEYPDGAAGLRIGYLPQKNAIDSRFPLGVGEVIASGLLGLKGVGREEAARRTAEMLRTVGLADKARASIGSLSGGQLQRALLGRALVMEPRLLVLDEPLSYVDKRFEHRIYDIIAELAPHTTILLVSHEMGMIAGMAGRHLIVDGTVHQCHSGSHMVHYDCDEPGC